jgi:malate dehydrogenase (quinone)
MDKTLKDTYDIVIIGAGVTGTALLYVLAKYTDVKRIALIEKTAEIGRVNSNVTNNSQTLHFGDIETNYSLEKATKVKKMADLVAGYIENIDSDPLLSSRSHKMVLAVGKEEVQKLEERYEEFKELFPSLKKCYREELAKLEPRTVIGRNPDEPMLGLVSPDGFAVNFGRLAESFVREAKKVSGKKLDLFLGMSVQHIEKNKMGFAVKLSDNKTFTAKVVEVAAGANSLTYAHGMGYAKDYILLPIFGSYFFSKRRELLNGKVYTLQMKKLPFAAVHGDPDISDSTLTRFGPTAKVLPFLERGNWKSFFDFARLFQFRFDAIVALLKIASDMTLFRYIIKNFIYDIPYLGRRSFTKFARKIIPTLKPKDLRFAKGFGGVRPQIVNVITSKLEMGVAKFVEDMIIFNITPSPGASSCLGNAQEDVKTIMNFFEGKFTFNEELLTKDLKRT